METSKQNLESVAPTPMVVLSAKVATAYLATRRDVPIEKVPELIFGVYRSLRQIAAVDGATAAARFLLAQDERRDTSR